jgi:mannose-1-phosphate guanylyltransferase
MIYCIILAGGRGERFWPYSTQKNPKQFLPIISEKPMIIETIMRVKGFVKEENIIIVAGKEHEQELKKLTPNIKLLLEPFGRNTACAIGYAGIGLKEEDIMIILPADHYVEEREKFLTILKEAVEVAKRGYLVTFGITPTRAETNYGYIEIGEKLGKMFYSVKNFKEKPNQKIAQQFFKSKRFLWNSGMFVWAKGTIFTEFKTYMPEFYNNITQFEDRNISLEELYENTPNISIDYAILEKSHKVIVIKADFRWDDIGTWGALERIYEKDEYNNVKKGKHCGIDTKDCLIMSEEGLITTIGVKNLIIVKKGETILVSDKTRIEEIRKLLEKIYQNKELKKYL